MFWPHSLSDGTIVRRFLTWTFRRCFRKFCWTRFNKEKKNDFVQKLRNVIVWVATWRKWLTRTWWRRDRDDIRHVIVLVVIKWIWIRLRNLRAIVYTSRFRFRYRIDLFVFILRAIRWTRTWSWWGWSGCRKGRWHVRRRSARILTDGHLSGEKEKLSSLKWLHFSKIEDYWLTWYSDESCWLDCTKLLLWSSSLDELVGDSDPLSDVDSAWLVVMAELVLHESVDRIVSESCVEVLKLTSEEPTEQASSSISFFFTCCFLDWLSHPNSSLTRVYTIELGSCR